MEIIQERLEREYNLDLITTAPSVVYKIKKTNGEEISIDNPTNYPDPATIAAAEEPITNAHIYSPTEYVGNIMELCQERRGVFKDMKYIDTDRVDIHYELPLNEISYDFLDALKSRTRGYASFDYEPVSYTHLCQRTAEPKKPHSVKTPSPLTPPGVIPASSSAERNSS